MDQTLINRIIEAALLASNQPLSLAQLRDLFPEDQPAPNDMIETAIEHLQAESATRGVELVEVASGFRYQVQADVHQWISRLWTERQTRYTRATLETLALIAYRQPITRGEIEQVRGVTVSSNIIKALEEREWIRVVGHRDVPGRPALFGTTKQFLDYFGLKRLDELPPLSELKDIGELEPQLQFDDAAGVAPSIAVGGVGDDAAADNDANQPADAANDDGEAADESSVNDASSDAVDATDVDADDTDDAANESDDDNDNDAYLDFRSERPIQFDDSDVDEDEDNETSDGAHGDVDPEAAPGERAVHENDHEQDNAVETTTVPDITTASNDAAESNENE